MILDPFRRGLGHALNFFGAVIQRVHDDVSDAVTEAKEKVRKPDGT